MTVGAWGLWHVIVAPMDPYAHVWWPASLTMCGYGRFFDDYRYFQLAAPPGWRADDVLAVLEDGGFPALNATLVDGAMHFVNPAPRESYVGIR